MVVKGNALKRRSEEAFQDTKELQETIVLPKEKRQKMQWFCFFYIYCLAKNWITWTHAISYTYLLLVVVLFFTDFSISVLFVASLKSVYDIKQYKAMFMEKKFTLHKVLRQCVVSTHRL